MNSVVKPRDMMQVSSQNDLYPVNSTKIWYIKEDLIGLT